MHSACYKRESPRAGRPRGPPRQGRLPILAVLCRLQALTCWALLAVPATGLAEQWPS